jgi:hypothetical protein
VKAEAVGAQIAIGAVERHEHRQRDGDADQAADKGDLVQRIVAGEIFDRHVVERKGCRRAHRA